MISQEFVDKYNLKDKVHNGYTFARVTKGIYILPQTGQIAYDALVQHLEPYGYHTSNKSPLIWAHDSHPINITLVVGYFGVNYLVK